MITIKTPQEIEIMHKAGKLLAQVMNQLKAEVAPGVTTQDLNKLAEELIFKSGCQPAFKGYQGFPAALCVSVNEQVVHGVPTDKPLQEGDVLSLDLGLFLPDKSDGFFSDMAITVPVGQVDPEAGRLIRVTKKSLKRAIARMKAGKNLGDIGHAVQGFVESQDFGVVRSLCGHGIGRRLHEDPEVLNYGQRHKGPELKVGMVLAIEPMVTAGKWEVEQGSDGFAYQTTDGSLAAHFEHTVAITESGPVVLTDLYQ